jgi:uncharacterized membrane protein
MRRIASWSWKVLIVLACVAYQYLAYFSVRNAQAGERLGLAAVSGVSHATVYLFLLWYFGRTLASGREPIITRFARSVHGTLQPEPELFTRKLTVAWCVFFAVQLIASALLFAFAPLEAWSLFINLLNFPLLALMFVGQSVYKMFRYPEFPRTSIMQAVQAFRKDASRSKSAECASAVPAIRE